MNLIGSGNGSYLVYVGYGEDTEVYQLEEQSGARLQDYLIKSGTETHLKITDVDGRSVVLKRVDIRKVEYNPRNKDGIICIKYREGIHGRGN